MGHKQMGGRIGVRARRALLHGLWVALVLAGCGGAVDSAGTSYDRDGSAAAVDEGKLALEQLLDTQPTDIPYTELTGIGGTFEIAGNLDPTYDEAAFWSALFQLVNFLEGAGAKAFLVKLGWGDLHVEFSDFAGRLGESLGGAFNGVTGGTAGTSDPPLHDLYVPNDPDQDHDPDYCIAGSDPDCIDGNPLYNPDYPTTSWQPKSVILFGTDDFVTISFQELYDFITGTLGNVAHSAVERLKSIPADFTTSLTATPIAGSDAITIAFDRFEVDLLQAVYGVLDVVTSLPTIWIYPGVDAFVTANSTRDPVTGEYITAVPDADLVAFFQDGNDGLPGGPDQPLRANAAGESRLKTALRDLLAAVQGMLERLASGDAMPDHLITPALIFSTYDDQPQVAAYGSKALARMVGDARATLDGAAPVTAFMPVATLQDFTTCDPVIGTTTDVAPLNTPDGTAFPATPDLLPVLAGSVTLDAGTPTATVSLSGGTGEDYVLVTVTGPTHLSVYTVDAGASVDVDTHGDVAYLDGLGQLVAWDSDEDAGKGLHFGISIDSTYFIDDAQHMVGLAASGSYTLYLRVRRDVGSEVTLHVQSTLGGAWPAGEPVFLKGGGGRSFLAQTYRLGSLTVNSGAALNVLSRFWDLSKRDTLQFIPDGTGGTTPYLKFDNGTIVASVKSVLPGADFSSSVLKDPGSTDIFTLTPDFTPGGDLMTAAPTADDSFGTVAFCAYPKDLSTFSAIAGGHLALPFF